MQVSIFRLSEEKGFILYRREKTKYPNTAPMPKYFITGKTYYNEFRTIGQAKKEFLKLTQ